MKQNDKTKRIETICDAVDEAALGSVISWAGNDAWSFFGWRCWYYVRYNCSCGIRQFAHPSTDDHTELAFFLELAECLEGM